MKDATIKEYRGYTPLMRYSEEDGCFIGEVAGLNRHSISFEGDTEEELRKDFEEAIDFYLDTEPQPEKPFSGHFTLYVPPEIHLELCRKAQNAGTDSFDSWLVKELKESVLHA
jgi:predicted HicB family RNase H-like nuclease